MFVDDLIKFALMRTIEIAMNLTILRKHIILYLFFELLLIYKIVLSPILFTISGISGS